MSVHMHYGASFCSQLLLNEWTEEGDVIDRILLSGILTLAIHSYNPLNYFFNEKLLFKYKIRNSFQCELPGFDPGAMHFFKNFK